VSTGGDAGDNHMVACYFATRYPDGKRTVPASPTIPGPG
jgi:hypothetical protein